MWQAGLRFLKEKWLGFGFWMGSCVTSAEIPPALKALAAGELRFSSLWLLSAGAVVAGFCFILDRKQNISAADELCSLRRARAELDDVVQRQAGLQKLWEQRFQAALVDVVSNKLSLGISQRMSVYLKITSRIGQREAFQIVGRHSANQELARWGQRAYSLQYGCLHETWKRGFFKSPILPSRSEHKGQWIEGQIALGLSEVDACTLGAPVRQYIGFRIDDRRNGICLGVVMFEDCEGAMDATDVRRHFEACRTLVFEDLNFMKDGFPALLDGVENGF